MLSRSTVQRWTLFNKHKSAEFGDKDAFKEIGASASDGAPYVIRKALGLASDGYRIQTIPADPVAQKALRVLKDPNAIEFLELAALRSQKSQARKITSDVNYFYAFRDFKKGENRNVKNWGNTGWTIGELQALKPLAIEIDLRWNICC